MFVLLITSCGGKGGEDSTVNEEQVYFKDYVRECFYTENGFKKYEDEIYTSLKGIDISEFQDNIDWQKIKEANLDFIYLRVGRRGATTGLLYDDQEFANHYYNASKLGVKIGVYFFSQAISSKEAIEEADFVVSKIKNLNIELPIVYDMENVYIENARLEGANVLTKTNSAKVFCDRIKELGYTPMIYTGQHWSENDYNMEKLKDNLIWQAYYGENYDNFLYPFIMWQYTDEGILEGIDGFVDLDIMFVLKDGQDE